MSKKKRNRAAKKKSKNCKNAKVAIGGILRSIVGVLRLIIGGLIMEAFLRTETAESVIKFVLSILKDSLGL